jgi:hypothetical protein
LQGEVALAEERVIDDVAATSGIEGAIAGDGLAGGTSEVVTEGLPSSAVDSAMA